MYRVLSLSASSDSVSLRLLGKQSLLITKGHSHLRMIVQDRPVMQKQAEEVCAVVISCLEFFLTFIYSCQVLGIGRSQCNPLWTRGMARV